MISRSPITCSQLLTADGRHLDLWQTGVPHGRPFVFVHGTPGSGLPFDVHVRAAVERGLRWVAWSRAGYGSSDRRRGRSVADEADDARAVLDHLGIEQAHVLGWSGGGPHALAIAAALPDRVAGVATIGGVAPWDAEGLDFLAGMGAENVVEFGRSLEGEAALTPYLEDQWAPMRDVTPEGVDAALGDLIDDVDRGSLRGGFAAWVAGLFHEALREGYWGWLDDDLAFTRPWGFELEAIRCPVHLWQGAHDRMVPYAHGQWLAAHIPTACPHLFDDQGHLTLVVDTIGPILDELLAGRR